MVIQIARLILNPDPDIVAKVITKVQQKGGHCPCQIEVSDDTLCPCRDFYNGSCHCKLYVEKEEVENE